LIGLGHFFSTGILTGTFFWQHILVGTTAGFFGSTLDSVLGALFQYSGWDEKSEKVVNSPGPGVVQISGFDILSNHAVNLVSVGGISIVFMLISPSIYPN